MVVAVVQFQTGGEGEVVEEAGEHVAVAEVDVEAPRGVLEHPPLHRIVA